MLTPRHVLRTALLGGVTGALALTAAYAGVSLAPSPAPVPRPGIAVQLPGASSAPGTPLTAVPLKVNPAHLAAGQALVGAARNSIAPRPKDMAARFPGARWETDPAQCKTLDQNEVNRLAGGHAAEPLDGFASNGSPWPENPDCIYMGGFGIGPMNPVKAFDPVDGLWVRSMAISDGILFLYLR